MEILVVTPAVASNIREAKTHQIPSLMQTSRGVGMQTLNDAMVKLVSDGTITPKEAYMKAVDKVSLARKFADMGLPFTVDMQLPVDDAGRETGETGQAAQRTAILKECEKVLVGDPKNLNALNNLAWIHATSLDDRLRDGKKALKYAERALELSHGTDVHVLDTLAAAYAENSRFDKAIATAQLAQDMARKAGDSETAQRIGAQLELYKARRPLRDA
jgi:tetratricopeptide (TPR) repeat protein